MTQNEIKIDESILKSKTKQQISFEKINQNSKNAINNN